MARAPSWTLRSSAVRVLASTFRSDSIFAILVEGSCLTFSSFSVDVASLKPCHLVVGPLALRLQFLHLALDLQVDGAAAEGLAVLAPALYFVLLPLAGCLRVGVRDAPASLLILHVVDGLSPKHQRNRDGHE
jgi:hypothetical protein